jgi:choline-glycine betaine transporter
MTISVSLPFAVLLLLMCAGLFKGLREELVPGGYGEKTVRHVERT